LPHLIDTFQRWLSEGDIATLSVKVAKQQLYKTFLANGFSDGDAKVEAGALWATAIVDGDRIAQVELDTLLRQVPRAAVETDVFAVEEVS
jgi:hypothetical protein